MRHKHGLALAVLVITLSVVGCAPLTFVPRQSAGWKTVKVYDSYDVAWQKTVDALAGNNDIEAVDKDSGYLQTAWKYGISGGAPNRYRGRITVKYLDTVFPYEFGVRTEAQWLSNPAHPVWRKGWDKNFNRKVVDALACCLTDGAVEPMEGSAGGNEGAGGGGPFSFLGWNFPGQVAFPNIFRLLPRDDRVLHYAKLDMLRVMICSREQIHLGTETVDSDIVLREVSEHLGKAGLRVINPAGCPRYSLPEKTLRLIASQNDVDVLILLRAECTTVKKSDDYYSFEGDCQGKIVQIGDDEPVVTRTAPIGGRHAATEHEAANGALRECSHGLAEMLSFHILRSGGPRTLLRRFRVDRLGTAEQLNLMEGLNSKPGIHSVSRKIWDREEDIRGERRIFWVCLDSGVGQDLATYLEDIDRIELKVERLDNPEMGTSKKGHNRLGLIR